MMVVDAFIIFFYTKVEIRQWENLISRTHFAFLADSFSFDRCSRNNIIIKAAQQLHSLMSDSVFGLLIFLLPINLITDRIESFTFTWPETTIHNGISILGYFRLGNSICCSAFRSITASSRSIVCWPRQQQCR